MVLFKIVKAFVVGGSICLIGQLLASLTKLTTAKIIVIFVVAGVFLGLAGIYEKLVDFAEAGATVPIINFGFILFKGVEKAIKKDGLIGIVYGGLASLSFVVSATVLVGMVVSLIVSPRKK